MWPAVLHITANTCTAASVYSVCFCACHACRFIKIRAPMLENKWPAAEAAVMYAKWSREVAERQAANAV